ncbi:HIT family protein [Candidatus Saccharibacteria bacterium]|nr:HIT family protein [Candidatus Saccharibacteria bacterium]
MNEAYPENCDICPIIRNPNEAEVSRRLIEGEYWVASLREDQQLLGTSFLTLKEHKSSLEQLTRSEDIEFRDTRNKLILAQKRAFGSKTVNISCLMNNAYQSNTPAPHVHWHFKPRYDTPVTVNNEVFTDPEFGSYIRDKSTHIPRPVTLQFIGDLLRRELAQEPDSL